MIEINLWLVLILVFLAFTSGLRFVLTYLNICYLKLHGHEIPPEFDGEIDGKTLSRITDYTLENARFGSLESVFSDLVLLIIVLGGVIPWLAGLLAQNFGFITAGLIFFGALYIADSLMELPFSAYSTFVIEKKYGFSTITVRLWLADILKGALVSIALLGILLSILLTVIKYVPYWWLWAWAAFSLFQLLMLWLYPVLIAPLFNKYEPVSDEQLSNSIISLMRKKGMEVKGVFQVDAGKRSRHTNAYFTGIGKTKRIVLYDTLLTSHSAEEILAVLAHELGHWSRRHVLKQVLLMESLSLGALYAASLFIHSPMLYRIFGFREVIPYAGLFLLAVIFRPVAFMLTPAGAAISRRFEREADRDACELAGQPEKFAQALKRLAKDNLANLYPHPLYAWFYYSHPPLLERIRTVCREKAP